MNEKKSAAELTAKTKPECGLTDLQVREALAAKAESEREAREVAAEACVGLTDSHSPMTADEKTAAKRRIHLLHSRMTLRRVEAQTLERRDIRDVAWVLHPGKPFPELLARAKTARDDIVAELRAAAQRDVDELKALEGKVIAYEQRERRARRTAEEA